MDDVDIEIEETHHRFKKDKPSGTAKMIKDVIGKEVNISSLRLGNVPGDHSVHFSNLGEVITISHRALSRRTFAEGVLKAANLSLKLVAGYYTFQDIFELIIGRNNMNSYEIIEYIAKSKKVTPVKVFIKGDLRDLPFEEYYGDENSGVLFCELNEFEKFLENNRDKAIKYRIEMDRRNSAIPLLDLKKINARIEPGAIIRDLVEIGNNAVIMMGAVINIGAKIGEKTMIDMNVVVGEELKLVQIAI